MNLLSGSLVIRRGVRSPSDVWELQIRQKRPREFVAAPAETHERGPLMMKGTIWTCAQKWADFPAGPCRVPSGGASKTNHRDKSSVVSGLHNAGELVDLPVQRR